MEYKTCTHVYDIGYLCQSAASADADQSASEEAEKDRLSPCGRDG